MSSVVRIMTFVTNIDGAGPGHSAVAVDNTVYTFEDVGGGWLQKNSGWKRLDYAGYLAANEHRPVLVQYLNETVIGRYVKEYVDKSSDDDDDYLSSGVCSQQVSRAVNYACPESVIFDPKGFDTPFGVYHCARRLGLVTHEEYFWTGRAKLRVLTWASIVLKLKSDYPAAHAVMDISR
jgi:hypothetical protein